MNKGLSIKLKAAFLILVFGLNTMLGFACSIDIDMGFNAKPHHDEEAAEAVVHIHKDGKKHIHYEKNGDHKKSDHHNKKNNEQSKEEKDNCCSDIVQKIEQADKTLPNSPGIIYPLFLTTFVDVFYSEDLVVTGFVKNIKQFLRSYHPPIPDIRIAIQSFQI